MATLTTKYDIGDSVWHAYTVTEVKQHPCPDCLGSRKWKCSSPAGGVFEVPCPRCNSFYQSSDALNLRYTQFAPAARKLTIGSVRLDTRDEGGTQYMCQETGVGSGRIYRETNLFQTEEEALAAAKIMASASNADKSGWVAKQYDKTVKFCDYELKDAEIEAAKYASRSAVCDVRYLLEDIEEAQSIADVQRYVAAWREKQAEAA